MIKLASKPKLDLAAECKELRRQSSELQTAFDQKTYEYKELRYIREKIKEDLEVERKNFKEKCKQLNDARNELADFAGRWRRIQQNQERLEESIKLKEKSLKIKEFHINELKKSLKDKHKDKMNIILLNKQVKDLQIDNEKLKMTIRDQENRIQEMHDFLADPNKMYDQYPPPNCR